MNADGFRDAATEVIGVAAVPGLVALGLLAAAVVILRGRWSDGLMLGLDFWLAACLLHLSTMATWPTIAVAAAIVVTRHGVAGAVKRDRPSPAGNGGAGAARP